MKLFFNLTACCALIGFLSIGCVQKQDSIRFVHLTDPHLYDLQGKNTPFQPDEGCLNFAMLKSTIAKINTEHAQTPFDFVAVSGDLGIEKLIEAGVGKSCTDVELTKSATGKVLFDGVDRDNAIQTSLSQGAKQLAEILSSSIIKNWIFVNGNNDLCNEDTLSIRYFNSFMDALKSALSKSNIAIHNLIGDEDHVGTFFPRAGSKQVFIGFENGSWKNNQSNEYAVVKNYDFQRNVLQALKKEVQTQKALGNKVQLLFHTPHFDDPFNASTASAPCANRLPTNVTFNSDCTEITPKLATNKLANFYSAWLVPDDFRAQWNELIDDSTVTTLFAGHFHIAKRSFYADLGFWQTQKYANIHKYNISSPIAVKNQILKDTVDQARGFTAVTIDSNGKATFLQLFADQREYYQCPGEVNITRWEAND